MASEITEPAAALPQPSQAQSSNSSNDRQPPKKNNNQGKGNASNSNPKPKQNQPSSKLRGLPRDSPEVRISKTLSWLLRHGAQSEGLAMRPDGYVKVTDLLSNPKLASQNVDLAAVQAIVQADAKQRYSLVNEKDESGSDEWYIRANQGHSIKEVKVELKPVLSSSDIPSGIAIHGTDKKAWEAISKKGLSKMKRNHIHLAQGLSGKTISGMRKSATVFIYVNVPLALTEGVKFFLSDNGVVLTEGDEKGFLSTRYFEKVEIREKDSVKALEGWETKRDAPQTESASNSAPSLPATTPLNVDPANSQLQEKLEDVHLT
ncbi:tRNA 2'-phosphotransferase [Marasmius crinis-equi]|uniref:2'-phosphotransferase n=1 Tax=Marasmius crinis-equi TaxID=585013 RepID=A0ABR3F9X9_9AGAR